MGQSIYKDQFGEIRHAADKKLLVLEWFKETERIDEEGFKKWLEMFAHASVEQPTNFVFIDARNFRHKPGPDLEQWRNENVIPLYNKAGVKKFAFLLPSGAAPKSVPAPEGPANFPTGYFDDKTKIDEWFAQE